MLVDFLRFWAACLLICSGVRSQYYLTKPTKTGGQFTHGEGVEKIIGAGICRLCSKDSTAMTMVSPTNGAACNGALCAFLYAFHR